MTEPHSVAYQAVHRSQSELIFVPVEEIDVVIKKEKTIPSDAPGVELDHHGDKRSFDVIVEKYRVKDTMILKIEEAIRDYEFNEKSPDKIRLKATLVFTTFSKDLKRHPGQTTKQSQRRLT